MDQTYVCPECGHEHAEPADASYVLAVLCIACEIAAIVDARASERAARFALITRVRTAA